jgi:hypothetical protein
MSRRKNRTRKSIVDLQTHSDIELRMLALLELKRRRLMRELNEVVGQYQQLSPEIASLDDGYVQYQRIMREEQEEDEPGYYGGNARRRIRQLQRRRGPALERA